MPCSEFFDSYCNWTTRCAVVAMLLLARISNADQPDMTGVKELVSVPAYSVLVKGAQQPVNIGNVSRYHNFVGIRSFVNQITGKPDIATMLAGRPDTNNPTGVYADSKIPPQGIPGRIEISGDRTIIGYRAGDHPVAGKCRTQISSFPVPSRRRVIWELEFTLGDDSTGNNWPHAPTGLHPVLIWQHKAPDSQPSMTLVVDADHSDSSLLSLIFGRKGGKATQVVRLSQVNGLERHRPINVILEAYLDEREILEGGAGYWRAWVNGELRLDSFGPTLSSLANEPHQWFLATYLYQDAQALNSSWMVYWSKAHLMISE